MDTAPGSAPALHPGDRRAIDASGLDLLIGALAADGYQVIGPVVHDGAIVYGEVRGLADLPTGWGDVQEPASYRLRRRDDRAAFGYAVGPHSWKRYLFPPRSLLWRAQHSGDTVVIDEPDPSAAPRYAFLGVRGCELAAIRIQDRVFLGSGTVDPTYAARREPAFIVAVHCSTPAATCFCTSMGTGPAAGEGHDLALAEVVDGDDVTYVVEVGTQRGAAALARVPLRPATPADDLGEAAMIDAAAAHIERHLAPDGLRELLAAKRDHPRWDDVADRCLACGNCTMVCPTCFCSTVEDTSSLDGSAAERWRRWDTCYALDFTHLPDGSVRNSTRSRYRQWLTHKLGTWIDQFGTSGCVGCGRCISWCPAGIDLTEEIRALREEA
ncbi:MAG TPA: 4Fe-4S dicluster domain-containing protein [Actinomycetota bacterium]|nr:4Fe-4S dicluster domain-containing protein [Actinomycetota bacterium]